MSMKKVNSMETKILELMQKNHRKKLSVKECSESLKITEFQIISRLKDPKAIQRNYVKDEAGKIEMVLERIANL